MPPVGQFSSYLLSPHSPKCVALMATYTLVCIFFYHDTYLSYEHLVERLSDGLVAS